MSASQPCTSSQHLASSKVQLGHHRSQSIMTQHCDVLIIGAGLAGLSTALSLPSHLKVVVLAKQALQACSSHYAQGGIAAVIDKEDSVAEHVQDTLIAGDGLCDVNATTQILTQGANAIDWLLKHDVPFTFTTNTHGKNVDLGISTNATLRDLHLTKEGGHGHRRVVHADDATGKHIMHTLHQQALVATHIQLLPYHEALSLITDNDRCVGAVAINRHADRLLQFDSQVVILASGGLGQLFDRATAPSVCLGDGIMMAWEAGCRLANLEFIQFHPTGLVYQDPKGNSSNFLISEAVRGEGGYLRCPLTHQRFMPAYDSRAELAPRDIVARAIANEIEKNGLGFVHLDITHQPASFIREHFPDIYAHCLALGIDITCDPIPVAPTAHYTCGGILTTAQGQTDIQGLYAVGEVANTGLHGANRLASNSLLECVVVGRAIASHVPMYLQHSQGWQPPKATATTSLVLTAPVANTQVFATSSKSPAYSTSCNFSLTALKQLMTANMGIKRTKSKLQQALSQIDTWRVTCHLDLQQNRILTLASLLLQTALNRQESRGGHYRNDYPAHASDLGLTSGLDSHLTSIHQPAMSVVIPSIASHP